MARESHEQYMKRRMRELDWGEYDIMGTKKQASHEEFMECKLLEGADYATDEPRSEIINRVMCLGIEDAHELHEAEKSYGDSWKQRGGVGAFMMLARKWDRLEKQVTEQGYDIFQAIAYDGREEGILDDIQDLRRYLFLVEAEVCMVKNGKRKAR